MVDGFQNPTVIFHPERARGMNENLWYVSGVPVVCRICMCMHVEPSECNAVIRLVMGAKSDIRDVPFLQYVTYGNLFLVAGRVARSPSRASGWHSSYISGNVGIYMR